MTTHNTPEPTPQPRPSPVNPDGTQPNRARQRDLRDAMPTRGRHGLLDALRGSTTERVLAGATVPVLALPVAG